MILQEDVVKQMKQNTPTPDTQDDMEKRLQDALCKHPEIKEAIEAMKRISLFDDTKAKEFFEEQPIYHPVK
jgi:hypothetical protein